MAQIDRTGTFRFQIVDAGIGQTKNGFPQWLAQLQAVEYYDEETEQWIDWSQYNEREITCYAVLFGGDGNPTLTAKQLQKALNWSGASFEELEYEYLGDILFQGRVEEHTYQEKTSLQVVWIDAFDAEPGRTLQKLDSDGIKKMAAKYASKLRELSGGNKPKSVGKIDKEAAKEAAKKRVNDRKAKGAAAEEKAAKAEPPKPPKPPKPPTPPKSPKAETETEAEVIDKGRAWIECCQRRDKSVTDEHLETEWHKAIGDLGGEDDIEENNRWAEVRDKVLSALDIPY